MKTLQQYAGRVNGMPVDELPAGTFCGEDEIPAGTFHRGDEIPPGTCHGEDEIPPGTFHGFDVVLLEHPEQPTGG